MELFFAPENFLLLGILLTIGGCAGFLAGLLGVGGGIITVPAIYYVLGALGYDSPHLMHMAVGTSLAVIVPTGLSAVRAHRKKGAVRGDLVKMIGPGIVIGTLLGTYLADIMAGETLKLIFAVALFCLALIMATNPARYALTDHMPRQPVPVGAGLLIGTLSTLMGIGGATLSVPFMAWCHVPLRQAVGTASALGLVIAVPAALGFVFIGQGAAGLPPFSLGYVNGMAWLALAVMSITTAPLGVKVAHMIAVEKLRLVFACLMVIVAGRMLWEILHG